MSRGGYFSLGALALLLALAGCGRGFWNMGERAAWRHDAEVACMKSGEVKLGAAVVQIEPIEGPGMCGADFPLKVSALGEANGIPMSYSDDMRPPASISGGDMPRWPGGDPRYAPVQSAPSAPVQAVQTMRVNGETLRWVPGPQGIVRQADGAAPVGQPMSLDAPGVGPVMMPAAARRDDIPDDAILPDSGRGPATRPAYSTPSRQPPPQSRAVPPLGPMRGPAATTAMTMSAQLTPAATLSCPIVSALDRWVAQGVQPAALRWFGSPVATIKQIGSYSCREMVGGGGEFVSEHAFGDALDVAGFTLTDGRSITVKNGWHGTPEEQGFLHDVQLSACEMFSTVLAPGYNVYHYDHIHVDLMRRASGRHPCRPGAVPGEVAAAKARAAYAERQKAPAYTGSIAVQHEPTTKKVSVAVPGADGWVAEDRAAVAIAR
jgi:hypothetical protein